MKLEGLIKYVFIPGPTDEHEGSSIEAHSPTIQLNPYLHQCCPDKTLADTTEALVGAYLLCLGPEGAWSFLEWLGMELTKQDDTFSENTSFVEEESLYGAAMEYDSATSNDDMSKRPCAAQRTFYKTVSQLGKTVDSVPQTTCQTLLEEIPESSPTNSALLTSSTSTSSENTLNPQPVDQVFDDSISQPQKPPYLRLSANALFPSHRCTAAAEFATVEAALNYRFNNHSLLQQAFTHTSLPRDYNSVLCSYEQLEFLGDALLDFLVTRHLYIHHRHMSPGDLTDLRSAVVNNYSFAALAVKLGFAKHLQSLSPPLFSIVNNFIVKLKEKEMQQQQVNHDEVTQQ